MGLTPSVLVGLLALARPAQDDQISATRRGAAGQAAREMRRPLGPGAPLTRPLAFVLWKLTVALELTPGTASRLFPVLSRFQRAAEELERERESIARDVQREAASSRPDSETLQVMADCLLQNHQLRMRLPEEQFSALQKYLTPLQQAKYLLLMPRLMEGPPRKDQGVTSDP